MHWTTMASGGVVADSPLDIEAKLAFDQEIAALTAQRTDLRDLQGTAKDIIGLLTLSGPFLGAFGKAAVGGILEKLSHPGRWQVVVFGTLPLIALIGCVFVVL